MDTSAVIIIVGAIVAIVAIAAATVAVVLGQIDGSSFSAIIAGAIGTSGGSLAHAAVANGRNHTRKDTP